MKQLKYFLFSIVLCLCAAAGFAQVAADSSKVGYGPAGIVGNLPKWALIVVGILYELIVRLVPTNKNYSILGNLAFLLNKAIPNNRKPGAPGGAAPAGNTFRT